MARQRSAFDDPTNPQSFNSQLYGWNQLAPRDAPQASNAALQEAIRRPPAAAQSAAVQQQAQPAASPLPTVNPAPTGQLYGAGTAPPSPVTQAIQQGGPQSLAQGQLQPPVQPQQGVSSAPAVPGGLMPGQATAPPAGATAPPGGPSAPSRVDPNAVLAFLKQQGGAPSSQNLEAIFPELQKQFPGVEIGKRNAQGLIDAIHLPDGTVYDTILGMTPGGGQDWQMLPAGTMAGGQYMPFGGGGAGGFLPMMGGAGSLQSALSPTITGQPNQQVTGQQGSAGPNNALWRDLLEQLMAMQGLQQAQPR